MDLYQETLLEHYKHPRNVGVFDASDGTFMRAKKTNVGCGDAVTIEIQLSVDDVVQDVRWQGTGCVISTAAMSVLSENIKGKTRQEVLSLQQQDVLEILGLESVAPGRVKCLDLSLRAIQGALQQSDVL